MSYPSHSQTVSQGDVEAVHHLLAGYSFEVDASERGACDLEAVIAAWLGTFGPVWVSHAITEALYQGRYKVVSIDQILKLWQRRGQPIRHFNREFESIILGQTLLCPTGYGEGAEGTDSPRAPLPQPSSFALPGDAAGAIAPLVADATPDPAAPGDVAIAPPRPAPLENNPVASDPEGDGGDRPVTVPDFRPLSALWPHGEMIRPFVPRQDGSELHQRLRAVVQGTQQS